MKLVKKHGNKKRRRGAALVEAAVVLPLFLLIVLGIIEFGRAMMVTQLITNGAREGARRSVLDGSTNAIVEAHVKSFLSGAASVTDADITVEVTLTPDVGNTTTGNEVGDAMPGDMVNVVVSIPYDKVSYLAGGFLSGKMLSAKTSMRHE